MKLLFLQLTFILIGSVVAFELNETLGDILKELRLDLDTTLVTLFPELAPEINKLRNVNDECYNKMVGNQTINIFNESIPTIITQFYVSFIPLILSYHLIKFYNKKNIEKISY